MSKIITKCKELVKKLKINQKLALIYIIACFLPVILLMTISIVQLKKVIEDKEKETLTSYLLQTTAAMDAKLQVYNDFAGYISNNQKFADILSGHYTSGNDAYADFIDTMDPMVNSLIYLHKDVRDVIVYSDSGAAREGTSFAPVSEVASEEWYKDYMSKSGHNVYWYYNPDNNYAFYVGKMDILETVDVKGIVYLSIDCGNLFNSINQDVIDNYGLVVTDGNGNTAYEMTQFSEKDMKYKLSYEEVVERSVNKDDEYVLISADSSVSNWELWLYKPQMYMTEHTEALVVLAVCAIVISLGFAILAIRLVTKLLTGRIVVLEQNMKAVEQGDFSVSLKTDSPDEIGELYSGFNNMVKQLNTLINEVYESRLKEKEYEMAALQAQINPHFLYNALSMINWKAIEAGMMDISKITLFLSTFYRTSLNRGKKLMDISEELDNVRAYLCIRHMMHDCGFDIEINVDEDILHYKTLNLILQPLIENAIDHGIDMVPDRRGKITILGKSVGECIEFRVIDNGAGMSEEQAQIILTKESKGYGVRNVNQRIQLFFGKEYHLQIKSTINQGTELVIIFPKIEQN